MSRGTQSLVVVGFAATLAVTGCRSRDGSADTEVRRGAIDFDTGAVQGTILWNGAAAVGLSPGFWAVSSSPTAWSATVDNTGRYLVAAAPPGDYVASLTVRTTCLLGPFDTRNVTVIAGETATADFDVTANVGRVTGAVASNGNAVAGANITLTRTGAGGAGGTGAEGGAGGAGGRGPILPCTLSLPATDSSGQFSNLVPAGSYTATFTVPGGSGLGSLSFDVVAGQTTDAGLLDVPTGEVDGTVSWNGATASALTFGDWFVSSSPPGWTTDVAAGQFKAPYVQPGDYQASIWPRFNCSSQPLATRPVSVTAGATTTVDLDVSATVGELTGSINVAGTPVTSASLTFVRVDGAGGAGGFGGTGVGGIGGTGAGGIGGAAPNTDCRAGSATTNTSGQFTSFLPVGSYTAKLSVPGISSFTSFPFTIAAGQTSDVGNINLGTGPAAAVQGTVNWNGLPAVGQFVGRGLIVDPWLPRVDSTGHYLAPVVAPGTYTASLRLAIGCFPQPILATRSVTVAPDAVTVADFDITPTVGKVSGTITTNRVPLASGRVTYVLSAAGGAGGGGGGGAGGASGTGGAGGAAGTGGAGGRTPFICSVGQSFTAPNGQFSALLPPGSYAATVVASSGSTIGKFAFPIIAGRSTDVDSVTTPACTETTTPSCGQVPTELDGGLANVNGLELTFSDVDVGGNTTVVASGFGPAPPTGFQIMGGRYWNIDTSASHAGPILVCIHYNPVEVVTSEDALGLVHDDGSGWMAITTSLCKSDGCTANSNPCEPCSAVATICGVATSLSPFAVVEPLDTAGPVFAGVPGTIVAYATSTAGATVSYTPPTAVDAVDGPRPVSCTPASGSQFPPGQHTVTCTTADLSGNPSSASFVVWVQFQAPGDGTFFLKPIRADGSSVFRIGRPVPVKFRLAGASESITDLQAHLLVTRISDEVRGTADDDSDEDGDETDLLFKYRKGKGIYAYRWKTRDQTRGTYRLRAELGDGVVHQIDVSLRKGK